MDKVKTFFLVGLEKTTKIAKETAQKVDEKYHDEEFQKNMKDFKEKVAVKSKELSVNIV